MSDNMDPPRGMTDADWTDYAREAVRRGQDAQRAVNEAMRGTPEANAAIDADRMVAAGLDRLPDVYGSPHRLITHGPGYAFVHRDTGEVVELGEADDDDLAAWLAAWKAQARIAVAALAAVEREACDRCDRAGTRTLHTGSWTIVRTSPKPPAWDAQAVRAVLEAAVDADVLDERALDAAIPLRPVPQQRPLMNLLGTLPEPYRQELLDACRPAEDTPRVKAVERR